MSHSKCVWAVMAASLLAPAWLAPVLLAQSAFNNLSFKGNYVFFESGSGGAGGSVAVLGVVSADGNGGVKGDLYQRASGRPAMQAQAAGQYAINQDGTGTMALQFQSQDTDSSDTVLPVKRYDLVVTKRGVSGATSDQGLISLAELELLPEPPAGGYNLATLKGAYGFTETGVVNQTSPRVSVGEIGLDGIGGVRGTIRTRTGGAISTTTDFTGSYSVNAAGKGEIVLRYVDSSDDSNMLESRFAFVVAKDQVLKGVRLDGGSYTVVEFSRQ